ncbi:hypothetical protein BDV98DRAFT_594069 [Pterulicium gracile]|uniref:Uncharacterized protein n=1 Tax=Pterulicium gracile TaxID=1884261 RepID=A0A5C3QPK5_9AGAR|nr:hypothetical protein BDV98DRAFT_594069 [Pterula gracilis]
METPLPVLICIVGGYMGYVGLQVLGDQDQANYLLCYLIHTQRVVHSPLYTEHLSRFSSSSSPYPPISASESIPASESTPAASSQLNSDTTLDKTSLLLFRTLIHHWLEVPPSQITTYFSALSALPPSAGVGPIVRSSLVAIKAHLAKADERDLGLASSRRSKGMGMGGGVLGGGKKLGTVKDRDESVDVMENQEDLIKLISEVADLTNEALGKLNALLEGEEDECECENGKGKGMQLELGLEYEEGGEGKKGSGNGGKVPKRRERKEYEDVE